MSVTTNQIEISELKNNFNILLKNLETALDESSEQIYIIQKWDNIKKN